MFSRRSLNLLALPGLAASALAVSACASTPAPRELVDARAAVVRAQSGPANTLVPAQVLSAQQALNRAEQAFSNHPDGPEVRDLAYIAQRTAQIAEAQGALVSDNQDKT